jgi:hypothetical protein
MQNRDAVRVAALRMLLTTAATPVEVPAAIPQPFTALLMAGRTERDICAALGVTVDEVRAMLVRLAR